MYVCTCSQYMKMVDTCTASYMSPRGTYNDSQRLYKSVGLRCTNPFVRSLAQSVILTCTCRHARGVGGFLQPGMQSMRFTACLFRKWCTDGLDKYHFTIA